MTENKENTDDAQPCCDGGTCCPSGSNGGSNSWKMVLFVLVVLAAGAVLARSLIIKSNAAADQPQQAFAAIQTAGNSPDAASSVKPAVKPETPVEPKSEIESPPVTVEPAKQEVSIKDTPSLWGPELDSLASLNKLATDTDAVFVLLATQDEQGNEAVTRSIEAAAKKIQADGIRLSAFRLKKDAPNYVRLSKQVSLPCVIAMVKSRGARVVSGDVTETKLIQAYVAASRGSGCCGGGSKTCGPVR